MPVRRGEIYWFDLPQGVGTEQGGRRPVLVIQNDLGNLASPSTIVASVTSRPRRRLYPFHVRFSAAESGLRLDGTVLCEQIDTVDKSQLGARAGELPPARMLEIDDALRWSLGLN